MNDLTYSPSDEAPRGPQSPIRFSVVSAVYNVAKYIDEFIESLVAQSLGFANHIELVLVDDGSTDKSAKLIRQWQKKYPTSIHRVSQRNSGPAAARNAGLNRASGEWVTFIDPDDFVADDYFSHVDEAIRNGHGGEVGLVSCAFIFFDEAARARQDAHPLRFRFAEGTKVLPTAELGRFIQLNVNSAFFRRDIILAAGLRFDERVRPVFEDASFSCRYTLHAGETSTVFLPDAKYFYRRRADGSSLLQTSSTKVEMYADKVRFGYLGVLAEAARTCTHVPRHVQLTVLYSLSWDLRRLVDNVGPMPTLSAEQRATYISLLHEVFRFIDAETVATYDVHPFPTALRVGLLNLFKPQFSPSATVEATKYDQTARQLCLKYRSGRESVDLQFIVDGIPVPITYRKVRRSPLLDETFLWEHIAWLPVTAAKSVSITVNGVPAMIVAAGRELGRETPASLIVGALAPRAPPEPLIPQPLRQLRSAATGQKAREAFAHAWLFMDRDSSADDSAEFLYRHVRQQRPDINAWFILKRDSPDWHRLAADGFRLIGFHEAAHALALMNASHLISSQADHYVISYLPGQYFGDLLRYRFVFLRHGVSRDDTSGWLNGLGIDLMITSTSRERESIVGNGSPYRFTRKECVLTGLPRHDALLAAVADEPRSIVIMPTWRSSLTGAALGPGNARSVNSAFYESEFARRWKSLLRSDALGTLAETFNAPVVFVPHPNMEQYLRAFDLPKTVRVRRFGEGRSMQGLFRSMAAFVTDYSSKAFDAAYVETPVIYYQFDREQFYSGLHLSRPGYFDFDKDGFGPVCTEEDDVLRVLEMQLRKGKPEAVYLSRAKDTFPFRDGNCSQRVLDAIMAMG